MTIKPVFKALAAVAISGMMFGASAANISFDSDIFLAPVGTEVTVTVNYDFINLPAFGGGFNVLYDPVVLEFVSYTQATFSGPGAPEIAASPQGALSSPGNYLGAGVGSFNFFTGINTAGAVGAFVFNVWGAVGDAGCGATLCLTPVAGNQIVDLDGINVTDDVFFNGITSAMVRVPVPIDSDMDGVVDSTDNCTDAPNAAQTDSNADGYGNACDADLNDDCVVNVVDLGMLRTVFFSADEDADFNGDGVVNIVDLGIMRTLFFQSPGPSQVGIGCP